MTTVDQSTAGPVAPAPAPSAPASAAQAPRQWLGGAALLLALAAGAGSGFVWWQGQQADARAEAATRALMDTLAALKQDQAVQHDTRSAALKSLEDALARQQSQTQELNRLLAAQGSRLEALAHTDRSDWRLAEAEYLLRMANHRSIYSRDLASARALLQNADAIVAALQDPGLHATRAAIADALSKLALATPVDQEGTYLAIGALIERATALQGVPRLQPQAPDLVPVGERPGYEKVWNAATDALAKVLVVQKRRGASQPVLDASDEWQARQHIRLLLEQAQAALLAERSGLYQQSLAEAASAIERDFVHDPASATVAAALRQLAQRPVSITPPDLSAPVRELELAVANRHTAQQGGTR